MISRKDLYRGICLPTMPSNELAEFVGILAGDGYMNYYPYQNKYLIEIAGDKRLDSEYLGFHVSSLILNLFCLKPSVYIRNDQNSMYLRLISKGLYYYLTAIGFKSGKKEQIGVPEWILTKKEYMISFMRGVADTDFSLHYRDEYPIISVSLKSLLLIQLGSWE